MTKRQAAAVLALAVLYFLLNPYWWIDALIYARDIALGPGTIDPGHLVWRPAGWLLHQPLATIDPDVDPLVALRILSALGAGWLCVATFRLSRACGLGENGSLAAAATVAVSQFQWAWGGSGSSYPAAAAAATASLAALLSRPRDSLSTVGESESNVDSVESRVALAAALPRSRPTPALIAAGGLFLLAWASWAIAVLILPALVVAIYATTSGDRLRRVGLAIGFGAAACAAVLLVLVVVYHAAVPPSEQTGLIGWVRNAGHGIPMSFSIMSVARAGYGAFVMFLHLGSLGRAVKAAMLGDAGLQADPQILLGLTCAALLGLAAVVATFGWFRRVRESAHDRTLGIVLLAAVLPVVGFAMIWQGSDIERFSPVIGPLAFALVYGLAGVWRRPRSNPLLAAWVAVLALLVLNLGAFVLPRRFGDEALTWHLGRAARERMPEGSVIIMTGQDLWGGPETSTKYFYDIWAYSVHYNVSVYGEDVWRGAVCRLVHAALDAGARVAVLTDFLGEPTPGGIGLIESEYPRPTLAEVGAMFDGWREAGRWRVNRFEFAMLEPGSDTELCDVPASQRGQPLPGLQRPRRR